MVPAAPDPPKLLLVTDRHRAPARSFLEAVDRALDGGLPAVLFREKDLPDSEAEPFLRALRESTRSRGALLYVAARPRLATAVGADALHLPDGMAPPPDKEWSGPLTAAAHDAAGLERAHRMGAGSVLLGPLFPTRSHPGAEALGPEAFSALAARSPLPVLAIGGITPENTDDALKAGAAGVACIDAILGADDPAAAVKAFLEILDG